MPEPIDQFCQAIAGHDGAVTACARTLGLDPSAVDVDVLRISPTKPAEWSRALQDHMLVFDISKLGVGSAQNRSLPPHGA